MSAEALPGMSLATDPEVKPRTTERDLLNLLAQRHSVMSMGSARYAYAEQVPSGTSWVKRRLDFMAHYIRLHYREVKA